MKNKKLLFILIPLLIVLVAAPIMIYKNEENNKPHVETINNKKTIVLSRNPKEQVSQERPKTNEISRTKIDKKQNIKMEFTNDRRIVITDLATNKIIYNGEAPDTSVYGYEKNGVKYYTNKYDKHCDRAFTDEEEAKENGYILEP
ncbi:hypothetical protein [Clostridium sp.]|uniref:hypothetical protein n=1 Tax=Clostridium sp. TaxID=1506 RepID=UPI002FC82242